MALCRVGIVLCGGFHPVSLELYRQLCNHSQYMFFVFAFCAKISLALPVISNFVPVSYGGLTWGGFEDCVIGGENGPCRVVKEDIYVIGGY
jgi:hypothetical protein